MKKVMSFIMCIVILNICVLAALAVESNVSHSGKELEEENMNIVVTSASSYVDASDKISCFIDYGNTLKVMDSVSGDILCEYTPSFDVVVMVPYGEKGVMLGSALPTDAEGKLNELTEFESGLTWDGEYVFVDYETGNVYEVDNPGLLYIAAQSGIVNANYSTRINSKRIPHASYPTGSQWQSGYITTHFGTGAECHGFGLYIYDYLFGTKGSNIDCSMLNISNDIQAKSFLESVPLGTLLRVSLNGSYDNCHTMILAGRTSSGVYLYHANWGTFFNEVTMAFADWESFSDAFPYVNYYICPHSVSRWTVKNSSVHQGVCTACGVTCTQNHYAQTAGLGECLACGYYGNMAGLTGVGHEEIITRE